MAPRTPRPTVKQYKEKVEEQERQLQQLRWEYLRMCRLVIEKVPPAALAKRLVDLVDNDVRGAIPEIVAAAVELPGPFGPFERRALCPMCGGGSGHASGFSLPEGLSRHLMGNGAAYQCDVMLAAFQLWDSEHGERVRAGDG